MSLSKEQEVLAHALWHTHMPVWDKREAAVKVGTLQGLKDEDLDEFVRTASDPTFGPTGPADLPSELLQDKYDSLSGTSRKSGGKKSGKKKSSKKATEKDGRTGTPGGRTKDSPEETVSRPPKGARVGQSRPGATEKGRDSETETSGSSKAIEDTDATPQKENAPRDATVKASRENA